jgi:ADP-ribose pyrophosphatase YjhB (NUDIX family)
MSITTGEPHDVFQKGLLRGGASLAHDPVKEYFYVEHPTEGWRVYLRACCFLHEKPNQSECIDYSKFLVVKRAGAAANEKSWEPPKGQMEAKDGLRHKAWSVMELLRENVKREVGEEARVTTIQGLRHSGLVLQGRESDYPPNHYFQYHIFQGVVPHSTFVRATTELDWYRAHPAAFARLKRDKREKDALDWYSPSDHKLMGKWSPRIVANYLAKFA